MAGCQCLWETPRSEQGIVPRIQHQGWDWDPIQGVESAGFFPVLLGTCESVQRGREPPIELFKGLNMVESANVDLARKLPVLGPDFLA